jgi:tetratricopeptide (TPR) repeat protein
VVHLAEREDQTVALKLLAAGSLSPELRERFRLESQILRHLDHPGLARVLDAGESPGPGGISQPWLALEHIEGMPLLDYAKEAELSTDARLVLMAQVCDAVQHAHERGVVHRDLKPSNILVRADGKPVVLDFGVARWLAGDERPTELLTRTGQLVGTPQYMSPEQVQAEPAGVGPESDVYSLGIILYELLSGRVPYEASSVSLHRAVVSILTKDPAPLREAAPEVSGSLERIVMMALEKEPRHRYANAGALADDLRRQLGGRKVRARGPGLRRRIRRWSRRRQRLAAALMGLIALAALGIAWVMGSERPMPRERVLASYREAESLLIDAVPLLYQGERTPDRMRQAVAVLTRARQLIEDVPPLSHRNILARRLEKDLGTAQMLLAEMDWDLLAARQAVTSFERALGTPFDNDPAHLRDRQLTDTGTGVPSDQEVRGLLANAELTLHRLWGAPETLARCLLLQRQTLADHQRAQADPAFMPWLGTGRRWELVGFSFNGLAEAGTDLAWFRGSAEAARQAAVWSDSAFAHRAAFNQDWPALGSLLFERGRAYRALGVLSNSSAALDTAETYLRWCATYRGPERPRVFAQTRQEWARLAVARVGGNPHSAANRERLLAAVDGLDRARTALAAAGAIAPQLAAFRCQQAEVLAELALATGSSAWLDSADVRLSQTATAFAPTSYPRMAGSRWIHSGLAEAARFELSGRPEALEAARIAFDRARTIGRAQHDSLVLNTVERTLARLELSSPTARSLR